MDSKDTQIEGTAVAMLKEQLAGYTTGFKEEFAALVQRPEILALIPAVKALQEEVERLNTLVERVKLEATIHAQEARTANATIAEIYQAVTKATGEPGNWNGAKPVTDYISTLEAQLAGGEAVAWFNTETNQPVDLAFGNSVQDSQEGSAGHWLKSVLVPLYTAAPAIKQQVADGWKLELCGEHIHLKRADGRWCAYGADVPSPANQLTFEFLSALLATPTQPVSANQPDVKVPAGYALVPIEPTPQMRQVSVAAWYQVSGSLDDCFTEVWKAMISAATSAQIAEGDE